jgi:hypothetical protein
MTRRLALAALGLLALVTGGALWLVAGLDEPSPRHPPPGVVAEPALPSEVRPAAPGQLTPPEVADPVEARALELLIERRSRYLSLLDGFRGRESPGARARLEPALRALWPAGGPVAWTLACRGETCRVTAEGPPLATWQAALTAYPAVKAVVDLVVVEPAGVRAPAYLVLAAERSGPGDQVLDQVANRLAEEGDAAACLRDAPVGATVELELSVDGTGITYRTGGTASGAPRDCVAAVLGDVITGTSVGPQVRSASRTLVVRAGR